MQQMQQDEFRNEPFTDFSKEENARAMREAVARVKSELGREYPLVIGGERIKTGRTFDSLNPANKTEVVGSFQKATTSRMAKTAIHGTCRPSRHWWLVRACIECQTVDSGFAHPPRRSSLFCNRRGSFQSP